MNNAGFNSLLSSYPLVMVDVGASYFLPDTWNVLFPLPSSRFVLFDPCSQNLAYAQGHPAEKVLSIPSALAGKEGVCEFFLANMDSGSSLYPPMVYKNRPAPNHEYYFPLRVRDIEVTTLHRSLDLAGIDTIHAIKLDTQGSELDIVRGLDARRLSRLLLVEMEVTLDSTPAYAGAAKLADVIPFFEAAGMRFVNTRIARKPLQPYGLDQPAYAAALGAQHEADVLFVRDLFSIEYQDMADFLATTHQLVTLLCAYYLHGEALDILQMAAIAMPSEEQALQALQQQVIYIAAQQTQMLQNGALSLWHRDQ
jgi:FkbM family methyltransferase